MRRVKIKTWYVGRYGPFLNEQDASNCGISCGGWGTTVERTEWAELAGIEPEIEEIKEETK